MQWSHGRPFAPPGLVDRLRLRRAAIRYAAHGWAVPPGACPQGAVLLATGGKFDVLEVPASVGLRALGAARLHADILGPELADGRGPVAVGPTGRWMFFVRPGVPLRTELDRCLDVVRHGPGSWVPAAPSRLPEGAVRWAVAPGAVRWRLPESAAVQSVLVEALTALGRRSAQDHAERPVTVPRQMSTTRRAV